HMESERLRNSLLEILSHDLRTPLTSLVGLADLLTLSKSSLSQAQLTLAEALRDEILRMSGLVANLLDMARIQSGDVRLNLQWQPFEEAVGNALRICRPLLAGHHVETRFSRELPPVRFDAILIERVMCNLLENAAKYTPADSHVVIAAEVSGRYLDISVFDNGPGLPPGREESLFEKFTRGERESATSGVGLGLSICRAIVEAHGGTIRAGKSPEGGASFIFTLPLGAPPVISGFNSDKTIPVPAEQNHA
ncbi:MAG: ATP-binding protein, partial [Burkholderiales bacterium]